MLASALVCLTMAVYHEARGEPLTGQQAVALVTMNRAQWQPKRVCREVHKPGQYSWVGKGLPVQERAAMQRARAVAADVLARRVPDFTGGATHFHAKSVRPAWRRDLQLVMSIGGHRFYRAL